MPVLPVFDTKSLCEPNVHPPAERESTTLVSIENLNVYQMFQMNFLHLAFSDLFCFVFLIYRELYLFLIQCNYYAWSGY